MATWDEYQASIPPTAPPTVREALRQKFADTELRAWAATEGYNYTLLRKQFLDETGPSFPKLKVAATSALEALVKPIRGLEPPTPGIPTIGEDIRGLAEAAKMQAQAAGVSPFGVGASEMAGQVAGMAPYFAPGMRAAEGLATGVMAVKGLKTVAAGITNAAYEGAAADQGHRLESAGLGLAWGLGGAAVAEFAGPAWRAARKLGLSEKAASAIDEVARLGEEGVDAGTRNLAAASTMAAGPEQVANAIRVEVTDAIRKADMVTPKAVEFAPGVEGLNAAVRGADGQMHQLSGLTEKHIPELVQKLIPHLDNGGALETVQVAQGAEGRSLVHRLLSEIEMARQPEIEAALSSEGIILPGRYSARTPIGQIEKSALGIVEGIEGERAAILKRVEVAKLRDEGTALLAEGQAEGAAARAERDAWEAAVRGNPLLEPMRAPTPADALKKLETVPDGLARRTAERTVRDFTRRSGNGSLSQIAREAKMAGWELETGGGKFRVYKGNTAQVFENLDDLAGFAEKNFREPLTAPNLVDSTGIPKAVKDGIASVLCSPRCDHPPTGTPPTPEPPLPSGTPDPGRGKSLIWSFFTPTANWISRNAAKAGRLDIAEKWEQVSKAQGVIDSVKKAEMRLLNAVRDRNTSARLEDFGRYLDTPAAEKPALAAQLKFTAREMEDIQLFRDSYTRGRQYFFVEHPPPGDMPPMLDDYFTSIHKYKGKTLEESYRSTSPYAKAYKDMSEWESDHVRNGRINVREWNAYKVLSHYWDAGLHDRHIKPVVNEFIDLIEPKDAPHPLGSLTKALRRHADHMMGRTFDADVWTLSAMENLTSGINKAVGLANRALPAGAQIPKLEMPPNQVLGKWVALQTLGAQAFRPWVVMRDTISGLSQGMIVAPEYWHRGGIRMAQLGGKAFDIADQYGVLLGGSDTIAMFGGQALERAGGGGAARLAKKALIDAPTSAIAWGDNISRAWNFHAYADKVMDALKGLPRTLTPEAEGAFIRDSGVAFLRDSIREPLLRNLRQAVGSGAIDKQDMAYRIAKELVEFSNWRIQRGAQPLMQKYAAGRLFGQFGVWASNYIEFGRRIVEMSRSQDPYIRAAGQRAAKSWAITHASILATGGVMGVDTGPMVFTQPGAFGVGPIGSLALNLPAAALDWEGQRGRQARGTVGDVLTTTVPGGLAMKQLWEGLAKDDVDLVQTVLGFKPIEGKHAEEGLHGLLDLEAIE